MNKTQGSGKKKRILLADDHPLMRQGLAQLINHEPDLEVCAQAEDVAEALKEIEATKPDIVVTDLTFRTSNGIELIKDIRVRYPDLPVMVLTMHNEVFYAERILRAGARGFVTKGERPATVIAGIRKVLAGEVFVSEKIAAQMIGKLVANKVAPGTMLLDTLSDREFEIFELIGQGLEMRQIAEQFHLSIKTVETHRDNIRKKLDLDNSADLLKYALQWLHFESGS
jgi:DNA-binding NarL/FixJ family response regulator